MTVLTADQFGDAVMGDYWRRQAGYRSIQASAAPSLRSKALGHPEFEELEVGGRKLASLAVAFIDLTDFTGRSFWDDEDAVVDLAHAVLSAFVEIVSGFGGFPLGLRGDGLFAGFGPGQPEADAVMALGACAHALNAVEQGLNPRLEAVGIRRVQARAGVDWFCGVSDSGPPPSPSSDSTSPGCASGRAAGSVAGNGEAGGREVCKTTTLTREAKTRRGSAAVTGPWAFPVS